MIRYQQMEMYDLGNLAWIARYVLLDAATETAVDVTQEIAPAPLLSATETGMVITASGVTLLRDVLRTGTLPEGVLREHAGNVHGYHELPEGPIFRARELGKEFSAVRAHVNRIRAARAAFDDAVTDLKDAAKHLRVPRLTGERDS